MTAQQPLSEVVRSWQAANGGDGLNHIQTRELIRALEAQEAATCAFMDALGISRATT